MAKQMEGAGRIRAIDSFRGVNILLMVFFTMILALSSNLPWPLTHNVPGAVRFGDFVLPIFLFASGMSIVYFDKKRRGKKGYFLDVVERIIKLGVIWFFLSPISSGEMFGMDEVMLSLLLFIPTILLVKFSDNEIMLAGCAVFLLYFLLQGMGMLPDFTAHYLGGYAAAIFYLPVMLAGVVVGRNINDSGRYIVPAALLSALLLVLAPPYKLSLSPSFMALSILASIILFELCKKLDIREIDYIGRDPIRYWVLMFVVLGLPLAIYVAGNKLETPLGLDWPVAVLLVCIGMVALYMVSKMLDFMLKQTKKIEIVRDRIWLGGKAD